MARIASVASSNIDHAELNSPLRRSSGNGSTPIASGEPECLRRSVKECKCRYSHAKNVTSDFYRTPPTYLRKCEPPPGDSGVPEMPGHFTEESDVPLLSDGKRIVGESLIRLWAIGC